MIAPRYLIALCVLLITACDNDGGAPAPSPSPAPSSPSTPDTSPEPEPVTEPEPEASLPAMWHFEPGDLIDGTNSNHGSDGVTDASVVSPFMRFPLESGPAFANSQIFGREGGGYSWSGETWPGVPGQENDAENFQYPWRDNFCEVRLDPNKHATSLCARGLAHRGQDIRPATCENAVHWVVAPEDGHISWVGSISVNVMGRDTGYIYKNLHVQKPLPDWVEVGAPVTKGQRIARVSDKLSSTSRATTVHLHFEIHGGAEIGGAAVNGALPPYSSLVEAYQRLMGENPDQIDPVPQPSDVTVCRQPQWP